MNRRTLFTIPLASVLAMTLAVDSSFSADAPGKLRVYIGTYSGETAKGIYLSELDLASGKLSEPELAAEVVNPSFLALHPTRPLLYAVSEITGFDGQKAGGISGFAIDSATGRLTPLNQQSSEGEGPCHLVVDPSGSAVLVANYSGGSVASLSIDDEGNLGKAASTIQHKGKSVNPDRQEGPHAHSINLDPAGRFAFAADLGLDQVLVYRFDPRSSRIAPNDPPFAAVAPGAGPRHFAFHPTGRYAYVINEMANTVTAFGYDPDAGELTEIQTITTLPKGYAETSYTAEVQVHPSGKFVYGSNRGHDSIAIFKVDAQSGKLTPAGQQSTKGKTPRNFGIDPTGAYLLAANQDTNNVVVFKIDSDSGGLTPTGESIEVGTPVCVKFAITP